ncbi:MAG TPA: hypothetical protein DCE44_24705, partial [Verrucomicrobiales bacterium]|nr:hypothetical protein [Verrucomicrobiales bacterium]
MPGVDGHSLDAADGEPEDSVYVDNTGKVGVGTTAPASQFHVVSRPNEGAPPRLQSTGSGRFNAGWDFYLGGTGKGYVGVPDLNAPIAPGEIVLFGGPGTKASLWAGGVRALTADTAGNVRIGANAELHATSGEENLRIVRGVVNAEGGIMEGAGFTVSVINNGDFNIRFNPPFASAPAVTVTPHM